MKRRKTKCNPTDRKWVAAVLAVDFVMAIACLGFVFI